MLTQEIGIDLGTANTIVVTKRRGIVAKEPSVVAIDRRTKNVVACGTQAHAMIGRTPDTILPVRPVHGGVISDLNHSTALLKYMLRGFGSNRWLRPRVILTLQATASEVDRRTLAEAASLAGAGEVYLMEKTVAAAIGAGLPVNEAQGSMLVDIGSGTTSVAVISLGGVVVTDSCEAAGDQMDEAIVRLLRREHNLMIGPLTAERLKMQLGAALPEAATGTATVAGRLTTTGNPAAVEVRAEEIYAAISETLGQMEGLVLNVFERTPPELLADISRGGMTITGGGSLLRGFDERLRRATKLPVHVAESPLETVAMGTRQVLEKRQRAKLRRIKP